MSDTHHLVEEPGYRSVRVGDHVVVKQDSGRTHWNDAYVICEAVSGMTVADVERLIADLSEAASVARKWTRARSGKLVV
jgi:hypothetical protein